MTVTIDDAAVQRLLQRLESAEPLKAGLRGMATFLHARLIKYPKSPNPHPTRRQVYGRSFESIRQQRWFFAALRDGSISAPYRRSEHLGRGWGDGPVTEDNGFTQVIGNSADYAQYVVGHQSQSAFMKNMGWRTTADVVEAEADNAWRTFVTGFRQSMQGR